MDSATLKEFTESLLDGETLNETLFYQLADVAKLKIEEERPWRYLITEDTTQTASSGDTFLTTKSLPSDFSQDRGLFVVDGNNNPIYYRPISYGQRYQYKDASRRYYVDLVNSTFALTGKLPTGYTTIHLVYKKFSPAFSSIQTWIAPARFHALIGFLIAEMHKGGIDYDDITARQALQNRADGAMLYQAMIDWDSALAHQAMAGEYETQGQYDSDGLPTGDSYEFPIGLM